MGWDRRALGAWAVLAAAGCSASPAPLPAELAHGALPAPPVAAGAAPPRIVAMRFSSLSVGRPSRWSGTVIASTNVASIEVRTNLFSIDVPQTGPGRFSYMLDVLDVPPIFVRHYRLRVIARNSAGNQLERDLPFEIR